MACGTFCSSQQGAAFCSDFDEGSATNGWSPPDVSGNGLATPSARLDTTDSTSCPASLLVDFPQQSTATVTGATQPHYFLTKSPIASTGNNNDVVVSFQVKLPDISSSPPPLMDAGTTFMGIDAIYFLVLRKSASQDWHVRLEHSGDGLWYVRVQQGMGVEQGAPFGNPLVGKWNHMMLTVHFASDATGSVGLTYDPASGPPATVMIPGVKTSDDASQAVTLTIGAESGTVTSSDWKLSFDSIVLGTN